MSASPARSTHRKLRITLITLAVMTGLLFGGYHWLVNAAQSTLKQRLNEHGLNLTCSSQTWSLWGGVTLKDAALRTLPANEPLIEINALHVDVLWREAWRARTAITRWNIKDATIALHDKEGVVTLQHFTTDLSVRDNTIDIAKLETANGQSSISVAGQLILAGPSTAPAEPAHAFQLNLKPVRGVLDSLDFKPGGGVFAITGTFAVDLRPEAVLWSADLHGAGKNVEWRGIPVRQAQLDTQLSQAKLKVTAALDFAEGGATLEASREGWNEEPLVMTGTLTDSGGRKDEFKGLQHSKTETLTITHLSGNANLVEFAHNIPAIAKVVPRDVKVTTFPNIVVRDFAWHGGANPPTWTLASLQLRSQASLIVTIREHPLAIDHLLGSVSYDHQMWRLNDLNGHMLGGSFALNASYDGNKLSNAQVALQSMHLDTLTPWVGKLSAKLQDAELTMNYRGVIGNDPTNSTGSGTLDLVKAPVVHVPLLDQAYQLFPKILSRERPNDTGEVRVKFVINQGVAVVEPMRVSGQSVIVSARGTVNLNKRTVDGHARANVRGVVGVVLAPVSVLFMEMKVSGPFDGIRVSPLGVVGAAKSLVNGFASLSSTVIRTGVSLPFEALGMFRSESSKGSSKAAE